MPKGIMILGPSGSGKTTLGKLLAQKLRIDFIDIDDYIWNFESGIPYTVMYSKREKIIRVKKAVDASKEFVMAGSMNSFHEHFDHLFVLAVYLTTDANQRVERVHQRELNEFGRRILPGGDMYESHQAFLWDVANYDLKTSGCNIYQHENWLSQLTCPVVMLYGGDPLEVNATVIAELYSQVSHQ